ncbi:MAG: hypothetical protein KF799_16015 [Bdellovibrionales bacterium]|nr:hypothetical protein [Bdellovibrionales bacterium]
MKEVPVWSCLFSDTGTPLTDLTVGTPFAMKCRGDIPVEWSAEPLKVTFPKPEGDYSLAVLKVGKLDAKDAELIVTGYKAGKHVPEYVRIVQGEKGFEVAKPEWEIKSVLKQGEQPQPFPPLGPFFIPFPMWVIGVALLLLAIVVYAVVRFVRRFNQRRRMLEDLKRHRTALSPLHQFYRDARVLRKRLNAVKATEELKGISADLDREFRLFVLRSFQIPTLDWSDSEILKDLRKRHRSVYQRAADPLKKTLRELVRLRAQENVLLKDVEQMHSMSLDAAERLENAREGGRA